MIRQREFFKKFSYRVVINGVQWAGFKSVSEPKANNAIVEHWEGGSLTSSKSPGRVTYDNVTLERGATSDQDLYDWFSSVSDVAANTGIVDKRDVTIFQMLRNNVEVEKWTLFQAWPVSFTPGGWDNEADENRMEQIELTYDHFLKVG